MTFAPRPIDVRSAAPCERMMRATRFTSLPPQGKVLMKRKRWFDLTAAVCAIVWLLAAAADNIKLQVSSGPQRSEYRWYGLPVTWSDHGIRVFHNSLGAVGA